MIDRPRADRGEPAASAPGATALSRSATNATAARLLAEGRARRASETDTKDGEPSRRRGRRGRQRGSGKLELADLAANLAVLPDVVKDWVARVRHRHRRRLANFTAAQRRWYRVRLACYGLVGVFVVLPVMLFFLGYLFFSIPTPDDAVNRQVATIEYADGSQLAKIVPAEGNRIKVGINQIPKHVQYAVLAAEDRSFFSNPGFDPMGIARAVVRQLTGNAGGGSTITQQFVKTTLVGDEHSLWRKYREMILAVKISQQSSKEDILADYLNAIYFGRGAYGIESASKAYFDKDVWQLTPAEGALLAGVIQSPSRWDPAVDLRHSMQRWNFVMDGMVSQGWLTPEQRATARFPTTVPPRRISSGIPSDDRGLILSAVKDELAARGITEQQFSQAGLTITTTIDPDAQRNAVEAVHQGLEGQPDNLRSALVSIDPSTGAIRAYYGGDNGVGLDYARVMKQPGSTFKPFVLLADLLQPEPLGLGTQFNGEPLANLRNADGASCQLCDLKQAMTISNNVIYHELALRVGPQKVADAARLAGITTPLKNVDAGIALGDREVTPVELASAYATIAAGGVYHPPHLVTKVTTSDDRVLYEAVNPSEQRFSAQVARNVTEAMLGVPTYDKLTLSSGRPVAAKTGTVQSHIANQNNDAWIAGFTPQLASVVWIGTDQNTPIKTAKGTPISGSTLPGSIWKNFMYDATKSMSVRSFGPFKPIGTPPAVTGPYDGFAAANPASRESTSPSPTLDPDSGLPPSSRANSSHRECGLLGCTTVQDEGQSAAPSSSPEAEDGTAEARSASPSESATDGDSTDESSGALPAARQPVRG